MAGSDPRCTPESRSDELLVGLPYALYCLDGGIWGLIQGGTSRTILPIRWKKLKADAETCVPNVPGKGCDSRNPTCPEAIRDALYAAILRLCQQFGYTNEQTYDCIQQVVDSVSLDPFEDSEPPSPRIPLE